MRARLRHAVAIGLTTVLAFSVFQHFVMEFINLAPDHPTTWDMVLYFLTTFFGSLGVVSLVIFPVVASAERLRLPRRLVFPTLLPAVVWLLMNIWLWRCIFWTKVDWVIAVLIYQGGYALVLSVLFCALFNVYCCIVWFQRFIADFIRSRCNATA